jgi:hypothetical protein
VRKVECGYAGYVQGETVWVNVLVRESTAEIRQGPPGIFRRNVLVCCERHCPDTQRKEGRKKMEKTRAYGGI